jgi:dephospho-CoA kinase
MGHGQHGKGTACKILKREFGINSISSSQFACDTFLFRQLEKELGYSTKEECYNDRHNHRKLWYERILAYNTPNLTRLGAQLFQQYDIYDGIRDRSEFLALSDARTFDLAIWVDASERMPLESEESIKVTADDADVIITNNGSPKDFERKLIRLFNTLV